MSEQLSGPQRVSTAAQLLGECPFGAITPEAVQHLVTSGSEFEVDRLYQFGLAKVVADQITDRLPVMTEKYPPYGLPELYRTPDMDSPDWRAVTSLKRGEVPQASYFDSLADLRSHYGSKLIVHLYAELEEMHEDPDRRNTLDRLADQARLRFAGTGDTSIEQAYEVLGRPAVDNLDVIIGLTAVVPRVIAAQLGRNPSHEEVISALAKSKRLPILPSLLARSQFLPYLVGTTSEHKTRIRGWGFDFVPDMFEVTAVSQEGMTIDYKNGISEVPVPEYKLDSGEFGDAFSPDVIIGEEQPANRRRLRDVEIKRDVLTCPSRKMISAIWADVIQIADQERIFEPK